MAIFLPLLVQGVGALVGGFVAKKVIQGKQASVEEARARAMQNESSPGKELGAYQVKELDLNRNIPFANALGIAIANEAKKQFPTQLGSKGDLAVKLIELLERNHAGDPDHRDTTALERDLRNLLMREIGQELRGTQKEQFERLMKSAMATLQGKINQNVAEKETAEFPEKLEQRLEALEHADPSQNREDYIRAVHDLVLTVAKQQERDNQAALAQEGERKEGRAAPASVSQAAPKQDLVVVSDRPSAPSVLSQASLVQKSEKNEEGAAASVSQAAPKQDSAVKAGEKAPQPSTLQKHMGEGAKSLITSVPAQNAFASNKVMEKSLKEVDKANEHHVNNGEVPKKFKNNQKIATAVKERVKPGKEGCRCATTVQEGMKTAVKKAVAHDRDTMFEKSLGVERYAQLRKDYPQGFKQVDNVFDTAAEKAIYDPIAQMAQNIKDKVAGKNIEEGMKALQPKEIAKNVGQGIVGGFLGTVAKGTTKAVLTCNKKKEAGGEESAPAEKDSTSGEKESTPAEKEKPLTREELALIEEISVAVPKSILETILPSGVGAGVKHMWDTASFGLSGIAPEVRELRGFVRVVAGAGKVATGMQAAVAIELATWLYEVGEKLYTDKEFRDEMLKREDDILHEQNAADDGSEISERLRSNFREIAKSGDASVREQNPADEELQSEISERFQRNLGDLRDLVVGLTDQAKAGARSAADAGQRGAQAAYGAARHGAEVAVRSVGDQAREDAEAQLEVRDRLCEMGHKATRAAKDIVQDLVSNANQERRELEAQGAVWDGFSGEWMIPERPSVPVSAPAQHGAAGREDGPSESAPAVQASTSAPAETPVGSSTPAPESRDAFAEMWT